MLETYFESPKMLGHLRAGPSGPYMDGFAAWLERSGYDLSVAVRLSLSRLDHRLPRPQAHSKIMQRTADLHHQIADALLPQPNPILDDATALDTTIDMLNPKTAVMQ
jgi:hypothetical protein